MEVMLQMNACRRYQEWIVMDNKELKNISFIFSSCVKG